MATLSLAVVLAEAARRHGRQTAVIQGGRRATYGELWSLARGYAAALRRHGIQPGDRVAMLVPNVLEFPAGYFGILAAGGVVVPVHLLLTAQEIEFVLRDSGAAALLYFGSHTPVARSAAAAAGVPAYVIGPDPVPTASPAGQPGAEAGQPAAGQPAAGQRLDPDAEPLATYVSRAPDDPAVVFYTSGTSGRSKGAVLSQLNLVLNASVSAFDVTDTRSDDVVLGCLPLFHSFGQSAGMNATFRAGGTLVLQPRFDPVEALALMAAEQVTIFLGVPTMYVALLAVARAGGTRPPAPRRCVSGGAALPVPVLEAFESTFDTVILEGYGLSETSPVATANQVAFGTRAGTVGHPIWGVEVEIARPDLDERIELLPPGELGEIVIRGHNVFLGYLNQPEATGRAVVDGWFRSGDLGHKDTDGFVTIVDRKTDMIIRGGFNVYPREVEEALLRHPAIGDVAVIGLPDEVYGEEICAVVVPAEDATLDPDGIVAWAREHVGRHKYPRRVEVVDGFPLGPSMKVLKRELRRRYSAG